LPASKSRNGGPVRFRARNRCPTAPLLWLLRCPMIRGSSPSAAARTTVLPARACRARTR